MRVLTLALLAGATLIAPASSAKRDRLTDAQRLEKALAGLEPGKPVDCIELRDARGTEAFGDTLLFRSGQKLVYRNEAPGCDSGLGETFVTRTHGTRLCRGDVITKVDLHTGFQSGFCIAKSFTPYRAVATR